jgi:hypothetical protein
MLESREIHHEEPRCLTRAGTHIRHLCPMPVYGEGLAEKGEHPGSSIVLMERKKAGPRPGTQRGTRA